MAQSLLYYTVRPTLSHSYSVIELNQANIYQSGLRGLDDKQKCMLQFRCSFNVVWTFFFNITSQMNQKILIFY